MNETHPISKSRELHESACRYLPGGVSRNMVYRKPFPDYAASASGSTITDLDGVTRVDFSNNMASLIHGHAHPAIVAAVTKQLASGTAYSLASEAELEFAMHLCQRNVGFEMIRFMNSGTEAVMAGIKAARAITGRPRIAKAEGTYHGTYDYAEVSQKSRPENWGSACQPRSVPVVSGTPQSALEDVVIIPFNNAKRAIEILDRFADRIACVMLDPLPHRAGLIRGSDEFFRAMRQWTTKNDCLLFVDEVISFRMEYGGAQTWYDVEPDLTALGKIIGGGFPIGALTGKRKWMSILDPSNKDLRFPYSGTFSANPVSMTAGRVAMQLYDEAAVARLNQLGEYARARIRSAIQSAGIEACVTGAGSMLRVYLQDRLPTEYRSAYQSPEEFARITFLVKYLYDHGLMMINTCAAALSTENTESEIDRLAETMEAGFRELMRRD